MQLPIEKRNILPSVQPLGNYKNFYDIRRINKLIKLYNLNCLQTCDNEGHLLERIRDNYTLYSYASRTKSFEYHFTFSSIITIHRVSHLLPLPLPSSRHQNPHPTPFRCLLIPRPAIPPPQGFHPRRYLSSSSSIVPRYLRN